MKYALWLAAVLAVSACGTDKTLVRSMPTENPQAPAGTVPRPLPPQPALQPRMRTVADILAAGGSQMSKSDLKGFLPGASWESHQDSGYYRTRFMPDGKYQNTLLARGQRNMDSHGYWYVDPKGRACAQAAVEDPTVQPRSYTGSSHADCTS